MDSKLQEAYELLLLVFKQWIKKENIPKKITLDFELGLLNAAESVLSVDTEIIGCYFHFKQCLRRKFLNLGVTQEECHVLLAQIGFITIINEPDLPLSLTFFEEKVLRTFPHLSEAIKEIEIFTLKHIGLLNFLIGTFLDSRQHPILREQIIAWKDTIGISPQLMVGA